MAEIVNLRRARKAKARTDREAQAAENRLRFGRPRAEREALEAEERLAAGHLAGHKLSRDGEAES
jgi:hypothetical protein